MMQKLARIVLFLGLGAAMALIFSCRRDDFSDDPSIRLKFSSDTVMFDTIFTTIGSSTRFFTVHNTHNQKVKLSSIRLAGGNSSFFRLNIDGISSHAAQDIEIGARDSIFVFVEVTVDPNAQDLPLIIADSIVFTLNGNQQDVKLVAWGQDAHFLYPKFPADKPYFSLISSDTTWTANKPHVIYGICVIDQGVTLTIEEGAKVHFHNKSSLVAYYGATLKVNGSLENQVVFQGDRLEPFYRELSGQWGGIYLFPTSKDNEFKHALIKNGTVGIQVDTIGSLTNPTLTIKNTIIRNMKYAGLIAQGSHVKAENLMINNCEEYALMLLLGGEYEFLHCSFANFNKNSFRKSASLVFNNYYLDTLGNVQIRDLVKAYFGNCIVTGSLQEELAFDNSSQGGLFNYTFEHCMIKTQRNTNGSQYINILKNIDPGFVDIAAQNFRLKSSSPLINAGKAEISQQVPFDLFGVERSNRPDIGAIQFVEEER